MADDVVQVKTSFAYLDGDGNPHVMRAGTVVRKTNPVLKGRESYTKPVVAEAPAKPHKAPVKPKSD